MSWKEDKEVAEIRLEFIRLVQDGRYTVVELCERFGVARSTAYKWVDRYLEGGLDGLKDLRRGPRHPALRTGEEVEERIVAERDKHRTWGPRKLLVTLTADYPDVVWPAPSTVYEILKRHGKIQSKRPRRKHEHPGKPFVASELPNGIWAADFKGQFRLGNGSLCYPLTVTDHFSRALLACHALPSTTHRRTRAVFLQLFKEYGLPEAILTDNGVPFVSIGLAGLSQLSIWWMRLGIRHIRTQPSHPQQNGRHERMHRTLKAEATKPPAQTMRSQQAAFDRFRQEYNNHRPHEALGQRAPMDFYQASPRPYPERLPPIDYPKNFVVRKVSSNGSIRWLSAAVFVTKSLEGQHIGLEETGDGLWSVYFSRVRVGKLDERTGTVK